MPTIEETVNTLKDMGFTEAQAKKALNKTGWTGIEAAAEWLLSNSGDDGTEDDSENPPANEVKWICSISNSLQIISHKSLYYLFITEKIKFQEGDGAAEQPTVKLALTEEERQAQLKRAEELRVKKRLEREQREKQEALEREKKRIEDGKQLSAMKQQMQN